MPSRSFCSRAAPLSCCRTLHVPVRSTWANAARPRRGNRERNATNAAHPAHPASHPSCPTAHHRDEQGVGSHLAPFGSFLNTGAISFAFRQVLWIFDLRRDRQPLLAVRPLVEIPVFGQHGVLAVGDAVLAQVPGAQIRRDDAQRSAARANRRRIRRCDLPGGSQRHVAARHLPLRQRDALPGPRRVRRRGAALALVAEGKERRVCVPASVSIFNVLSSCQVMCSRPGTLIKAGAPYDRHCSPAASSFAGSQASAILLASGVN